MRVFQKALLAVFLLFGFSGIAFAEEDPGAANPASVISNFHFVKDGVAVSANPGFTGLETLAEKGFRTVIDLRRAGENTEQEAMAASTLGMAYLNIPVNGQEKIPEIQLEAFTEALENAEIPIVIFCASGNRAAAMWAAYRLSQGEPWETALKEGLAAGMNPAWEERLRPYCKSC